MSDSVGTFNCGCDYMIKFENVSFNYTTADEASVNEISLNIKKGEVVLLCGRSGCGKTTLIRMINGLIPHFYEGSMKGHVYVDGLDVANIELYETAKKVGSVFQNPRSQFFCVDSTSELAFGPENMGLGKEEIMSRISKTVSDMNIEKLMNRSIFDMSGGEKQKIACASVDTLFPKICVLDEPSSNLSLEAIESLKRSIAMWKQEGKTIVIAEHRLYWLKDLCDRVICLDKGNIIFDISMKEFELFTEDKLKKHGLRSINEELSIDKTISYTQTKQNIILENFTYSYKKIDALHIDHLEVAQNEIIAVIGPNGAGKSTFSKCLCGLMKNFKGYASINGEKYSNKKLLKKSYMVMQDVNHQLFCETVIEEVMLGMNDEDEEYALKVLDSLGLKNMATKHPMSLSGGQKQRVAVASALLSNKEIIIFDEPTSGLDFDNMEKVANMICSLRGLKTVFVITHDPDLIRRCATVVLRLENGYVSDFITNGEKDEKEEKCYNTAV